ncbi:MAG: ATP-binding protein [Verrucomicrobia bacterium]|jgi:two-component system sensor histidine kinase PhcS|nr:ATP-binding protein [Verrucomicrobiota bacterium]
MPDTTTMEQLAGLRAAFVEHERQVRISTGRLACWLVIFLMPLGTIADWFMYPDRMGDFLKLRLLCSFLVVGVWLLHSTPLARKHYPVVGMPIVLLPAFFMMWMVFSTANLKLGGAASPYYAALNLILLAVSAVGHWSMRETFFAVGSVLCMYLGLAFPLVSQDISGIFFINVYFLGLTGIIVIAGNHLFNRLRFREFVLRQELDKNKKTLEQTNQKLDTQNQELADTIKKLTEAELQLVQHEKMASLGVMSAGIIHEINNPLNYATTGLYTLRQKGKYLAPEQQEEYADVLKDVEEGVSRVKNIVSDLRMFTHPNTDSHDQVEMAEVIEPVLRFLSAEIKDRVRIEQQWPEHLTVTANKQKLIHVFTNLMQNSLDALKIKTFTDEQPTIWIGGRAETGRRFLTIRDNGTGIASQHLDKIFDPFFTTKDVGEGMGLGLSICYRIVQECEGRISVNTQPGKFCEFTLEFPAKE